jgi:Spy/CpxP family protein refolding chaperone
MADGPAPRPVRGQLAVIAIFALGVVFGVAISFVVVHHWILPNRGGHPRGGQGPVAIDWMAQELDLDATQKEQIGAIIEKGHATMRGVLDQTTRDIRALLRPDQQQKFDRMHPRSPFGRGPHAGEAPGRGPHPPGPSPEPPN